jgi:hypothetical protein
LCDYSDRLDSFSEAHLVSKDAVEFGLVQFIEPV